MRFVLAALTLAVFGITVSTVPPTVYLGDSGEIVSGAYTLGIAHPPGYPLYMLAGKAASVLIPFGDAALRMNIMSALFAAVLFLALYNLIVYVLKILYKQKKGTAASITAVAMALVFIFSYIFWSNSSQAKGGIYVLTLIIESLALLYCFKFIHEKKTSYLLLASYLAGFLPTLHQGASLIAVFMIAALVLNAGKKKPVVWAAAVSLAFVSFATPDIYLFIRASAGPEVWWNNIKTPGQIFGHIIRKVYLTSPETPLNPLSFFFKLQNYAGQFISCYKAGVFLLFIGLVVLARRNKKLLLAFISFFILNLLALMLLTRNTHTYMNLYVNSPYFLFMDLAAIVVMAAGAFGIISLLKGKNARWRAYAACLLFIMPLWACSVNYKKADSSVKFSGYDQPVNVLKVLKPGDKLFVEEDYQIFDIMYLKYVKHMFRDIDVYDRTGNFLDSSIYDSYKKAMVRLTIEQGGYENISDLKLRVTKILQRNAELNVIMKNPGKVYFADPVNFPEKGIYTMPYAMVNRVYTKSDKSYNAQTYMLMMTFRDYYNNKDLDLYYRDVLARYFVQRALYAAYDGDKQGFDIFRSGAENLAGDNGAVLNRIAYIYYQVLSDRGKAVEYMERIMSYNPYDYVSLNVLITFCLQYDRSRALGWMKYFYKIAPGNRLQNEILIDIQKLQDTMVRGGIDGKQ